MQGIETRLKTISGLRTAAFRPDQVNPPQAYVSIPTINYHAAFVHGQMRIEPVVTILISKALDRVDQPLLASFMDIAGTKSIHAAIEADKTLGITGCECVVMDCREADIALGGINWYAGVFNLNVIAPGA